MVPNILEKQPGNEGKSLPRHSAAKGNYITMWCLLAPKHAADLT